jgi:hemoglobin
LFLFACGGSSHKASTPPPVASDGEKPEPPSTAEPPATSPAPAAPKSLFDRLGGLPAITAVVDEFVNRTTADPRIKERFFNTDAVNLKRLLTEFVCAATGGPCQYTGRDMPTSHAGMDLVDDEFTALVENLIGALDKFKVPDKEKGELLGALGPLKPQIVVTPDKLKPIDDAKLAPAVKLAGTLKDKAAADLLNLAIVAGKRGQRSYAEQLFTRAELVTGPKPLASVAAVFRAGAPPRVMTALKTLPADTAAQPQTVGGSETDAPDKKPAAATLHGLVKIDGKAPTGLGVVMLWPEKGAKKRQVKQRIVEQRGKAFAPHVMAVPVGSTVSFPNFDPIFHNVFSLSSAATFDLRRYPRGQSRTQTFPKAGIVKVYCNIHSHMSATILVLDNPYFAIPGLDGGFELKNVPTGQYTLIGWHERVGERKSLVRVERGKATTLDLSLPVEEPQ